MNETTTSVETQVATPKAETKPAKAARKASKSKSKAKSKPAASENGKPDFKLKLPQFRVLKALSKTKDGLTRGELGSKAGYTPISGTVSRALSGSSKDSAMGKSKGVIDLGYVKPVELDLDGVRQTVYQITGDGRKALARHVKVHGEKAPKVRDRKLCINARYVKKAGKGKR